MSQDLDLSTVAERRARSVLSGMAEWVAKAPSDPAVICGEEKLTYLDLDRRANRLARALQDRGAGPERLVGLAVPRGIDLAVAVLGVLKAGAAYLPFEPQYPDLRIISSMTDSGADVLVTDAVTAERFPSGRVPFTTMDVTAAAAGLSDDPIPSTTNGDSLQYVIYTSGSTGRPKGIAMTQGPQVTLLDWCRNRYADRQPVLQYFPITADVASLELLSIWWTGGCAVIASDRERYDISALARLIRQHRISRVLLPVAAMQQLADHAVERPEDVCTLREFITTGDRLVITPNVRTMCAGLPGVIFDDHYGSTEVNVVTAPRLAEPVATWPDRPLLGRPIVDARIYLLDDDLNPVPRNVPGAIYVGGGPLARGYTGRGGLTAEAFIPDPFIGASGARMYRTGDLGRWRADGLIEFLGRADFQIKLHGLRIEPGEVETLLRSRDDVAQAVVMAVASEDGDASEALLVAYVVPADRSPGAVLHTEPLRDHLAAHLPSAMIPQSFVVIDDLPMTETGKVDRRRLPHPDVAEPDFVAPRDEVEAAVAKVWGTVLDLPAVGVRHNFFQMGGHSLLITRVIYELRETFGADLPMALMFQRPTVESFAAEVRRLQRASTSTQENPAEPVTT
ncbi:non-ribosomal peptide synthetase [Micromonospora arborensis]|uniref:non-ribosomal peptide synthetase n=1 Tax=Micromonospora arborensis TaxID=2116518 RepID=UPI0033F39B70